MIGASRFDRHDFPYRITGAHAAYSVE